MLMESYKGWNIYDYYQWLIEKVNCPVAETHTMLLEDLHNIPFRWSVHRDRFRAKDGLRLRADYLEVIGVRDNGGYIFTEYGEVECSVLEMIIALAEDFSVNIIGRSFKTTAEWFWIMIDNLGLMVAEDRGYHQDYVRDRVSIFIDRAYSWNGEGGMFPLKNAEKDQRRVELWYQLSEWFKENYWDIGDSSRFY